MRARRLSVLLAAVALTGCTQTVHGTAVARFSLPVDGFPSYGGIHRGRLRLVLHP